MTSRSHAPIVSVIMANHNGSAFAGEAVRSVLGQSLVDLELVFMDDASGDDSVRQAQDAGGGDPRLRIGRLTSQLGPGGARNRALALARGRWIAIVDSDDVIEPQRLERLLAFAQARGADLAADNLLVFSGETVRGPMLRGRSWRTAREVRLAEFALSNRAFGERAPLGFLKPLIRRAILARTGAAYDESLRIGEDFDLIARLLAAGARYWVDPAPLYRYRKHPQSTSHRLKGADIEALLAADDRFLRLHDRLGSAELEALARRRRSLERALAYDSLVTALKARAVWRAAGQAIADPTAVPLLLQPVAARIARIRGAI